MGQKQEAVTWHLVCLTQQVTALPQQAWPPSPAQGHRLPTSTLLARRIGKITGLTKAGGRVMPRPVQQSHLGLTGGAAGPRGPTIYFAVRGQRAEGRPRSPHLGGPLYSTVTNRAGGGVRAAYLPAESFQHPSVTVPGRSWGTTVFLLQPRGGHVPSSKEAGPPALPSSVFPREAEHSGGSGGRVGSFLHAGSPSLRLQLEPRG